MESSFRPPCRTTLMVTCLPSRDMPAQAQALVEKMKATPVSTDPLKGVLPSSWGDAGPDEPLSLSSADLQGAHRRSAWHPARGLAAGGQGGAGSWPRSQALGSLSQSWLPRALLYKHKALKIGCPFQPLPLSAPQNLTCTFFYCPVPALWTVASGGLLLWWRLSGAQQLLGLPGISPPYYPAGFSLHEPRP